MPTLKYDRNATGTGSGGSWVNAISNPATFLATQLSGGGGETRRHEFAMGDNPWPFTANKTENEGSARLEIVGVDPGNGSTQKPRFPCYEDVSGLTGWVEVNPAWIGYPNATNGGNAAVVAQPGSNLWYRAAGGPARWAGAFRVGGELLWGRRCRSYIYANDPGPNSPVIPSSNYQYGTVASTESGVTRGPGGFLVYWDGAGDPSSFTWMARPSGVSNTDVWTINRPVGGLELANLDFTENDFPINVLNSTANSLIENVWVHHNSFRRCRKGFSVKGSGAEFQNSTLNGPNYRTGAGFKGLVFEHNIGYQLGQQLFHAWNSPAMNQAHVRFNRSRYNNMNEGSGGTFYWDSSYTTDGSRSQCYQNWVDRALYDGLYWLDGSAFYSEFGSANVEYWGNLITNTKVGVHLNIGQGSQYFHNNVMKSTAEAHTEAAVRIVTAALATGVVDWGDAHVYANLADRFSHFIGIIEANWWDGQDRTRIYCHRNIARGRQSLDAPNLTPLRGNNGIFDNNRTFAYKNNFNDFAANTNTASEYSPGTNSFPDSQFGTTRLDSASLMSLIPVAPDSDGLTYDLALEAPTDIGTLTGTTTALRAGKPTVMPA